MKDSCTNTIQQKNDGVKEKLKRITINNKFTILRRFQFERN